MTNYYCAVVETGSWFQTDPVLYEEAYDCGHHHNTIEAAEACLDRHRQGNSVDWYAKGRVHDHRSRRVRSEMVEAGLVEVGPRPLKTYYKVTYDNSGAKFRGRTDMRFVKLDKVQSFKPEDHMLSGGDRVYRAEARSIHEAKALPQDAWTRPYSL